MLSDCRHFGLNEGAEGVVFDLGLVILGDDVAAEVELAEFFGEEGGVGGEEEERNIFGGEDFGECPHHCCYKILYFS